MAHPFPSSPEKASKVWIANPDHRLEWLDRMVQKNRFDLLTQVGSDSFPLDLEDSSVLSEVQTVFDQFKESMYWNRLCVHDCPEVIIAWQKISPETFKNLILNLDNTEHVRLMFRRQALGVLRLFVEKKWTMPEISPSSSGGTFLHAAASYNWSEGVSFLLEVGLDPNALNPRGRTALHQGAWKGDAEIARLLIEGGVDFNKGDERGKSALAIAAIGADGSFGDYIAPNLEYAAEIIRYGASPHQRLGSSERSPLLLDKAIPSVQVFLNTKFDQAELVRNLPVAKSSRSQARL